MNINSMIEQVQDVEASAELDYLEERIEAEIEEAADAGSYPRYGYTTAQVFESAEEWITFKKSELREAITARRAELAKVSI